MHFKGRLSAPSLKVLLFSPLSSCLRRLRLPWQHQKPLTLAHGPRALEPAAAGSGKRPDPCCPALALGATAALLGCPGVGGWQRTGHGAAGTALSWVRACSLQQPARLSSSFVPELIYFLSTSDVRYLDF